MIPLSESIGGAVREVVDLVEDFRSEGRGREVLGLVPGRPESEDVEIGLDRACQDVIESWLNKLGLAIEIHSEHGLSRVGDTVEVPEYLVAVDPFDGSGLYARGIPAEWWSVLSVYEPSTLEPVAAAAADVIRREIYMADGDGVTVASLDRDRPAPVEPSRQVELSDDTVLAVYLMSPVYRRHWTGRASDFMTMLASRFPGCLLWPNGGSCIYPWIARGVVHAYVSFDEPVSEIDPGLAFARSAGFPVFSVQADGTLVPHTFVPGNMAKRVPFLVAACTEDLAGQVVAEIRGT